MPPAAAEESAAADGKFHFILVQDSKAGIRRQARSHAIKRALQKKRELQLEARANFRNCSSQCSGQLYQSDDEQGRRICQCPQLVYYCPSQGELDPFEVLAVDSKTFQRLLFDSRAQQASEPVFSVAPDSSFHSFPAVFRGGLDDPALGNAVMFMLSFSIAEGVVNRECLTYQTLALSQLRERMGSVERAASLGSLGAILFLAGVEARLGMRDCVQTHLEAIAKLLELGKSSGLALTSGIKRAIYWQDLNASVMSGSSRIFRDDAFTELQWKRDPFTPQWYRLPRGFQPLEYTMSGDFVSILEDVHALQLVRNNARRHQRFEPAELAYINNHQASIQSRLLRLGEGDLSPMLDCIRLAAYLCSSMLCCRVWCGKLIPDYITRQLLQRLRGALVEDAWDHHVDLLRWLICMGGSFASAEHVRAGYLSLVRDTLPLMLGQEKQTYLKYPVGSLDDAMCNYIWSADAFGAQAHSFWTEVAGQQ